MGHLVEKYWQEYLLCVLFQLLFPVLPILLEQWITGGISGKSLMLTTAIYSISVGNSSHEKLLFGLAVVISIIFAVNFGIVAGGSDPLYKSGLAATVCIFFLFLISLFEKYAVHVTEKKLYWKF